MLERKSYQQLAGNKKQLCIHLNQRDFVSTEVVSLMWELARKVLADPSALPLSTAAPLGDPSFLHPS